MRKTFTSLAVALLFCAVAAPSYAQRVGIWQGDVYFVDAKEQKKRLTWDGLNSAPALSPDRRQVVFVKETPEEMVSTGVEDQQATELYVVGVDGKNLKFLLRGREAKEMQNVLAGLWAPQFSTDGKTIYFLSYAWTTSGAVHAISLVDKKERFVCAGNEFEVIRNGQFAGKLIVLQHRYRSGGSYDYYYVMDTDGKEVREIGEDTKKFKTKYIK